MDTTLSQRRIGLLFLFFGILLAAAGGRAAWLGVVQADELKAAAVTQAAEIRTSLQAHFELSSAIHGEARAARLMRKIGARAAEHHDDAAVVRSAFTSVCDRRDWIATLERFYPIDARAPHAIDGP